MKKMLADKNLKIKEINAKYEQARKDLDFFKTRNKELEGVLTRMESTYLSERKQLQDEIKASKEAIVNYDRKNKEISSKKDESIKKSR